MILPQFRADAGGADRAGRGKMVAAMQRLQSLHEKSQLPEKVTAFGIDGGKSGWAAMFSTHPPPEDRIEALRAAG